MANLIADRANVDDRKWLYVAAMLNGWHTAGSVTWLAFRLFDIPTPGQTGKIQVTKLQ